MEPEDFTPLLEEFLLSPLVCWVRTLSPLADGCPRSQFLTLVDGVFLSDVMMEISGKWSVERVQRRAVNDSSPECLRIQNLCRLTHKIRTFYQEMLQQLVVMSLPDVLVLGQSPLTEQGLEETRKLLLLLLGCAVQCERKEEYIEKIQMLDFDTQAAIAAHIQEVTQDQEKVCDLQTVEESDKHVLSLNLKRLVNERDQHAEMVVSLSLDCALSLLDFSSVRRTESVQHLSVELADAKAKARRLRQELEEKTEQLLDSRQEVESLVQEVKRLQQENQQLACDARSLRAYRDELDALREKAMRVDKLESEVSRCKEKLHDIDFYRTRLEELKEDNQVLLESRGLLEDQLISLRARSDKHHELEKQNLQLKNKIHDMETERDAERRRMEELLEENLALEISQKQSMDESLHLNWELEQLSRGASESNQASQKSLGQEVCEQNSSQLLKLEKENQRLRRTEQELREQLCSLQQEIQHLNSSFHHLGPGGQGDIESRVREVELENQALQESIAVTGREMELKREMAERLERESLHLTQERDSLLRRSTELESLHHSLERENSELTEENLELRRNLEDLRPAGVRVLQLEQENSELTEELRRSLELQRTTSRKSDRLERSLHSLEQERQRLERGLDTSRSRLQQNQTQLQETEAEIQSLQGTVEKLQTQINSLEPLAEQSRELERASKQLERENQRLRQQGETREARMEKEQIHIGTLERENRSLVRELEVLREAGEKLVELEREHREMQKQTSIDRRTLAALREELVEEKLKSQQISNELEKLSQELEKIGLDRELLEQQESSEDRFRLLESKLEATLRSSVEIKMQKISALEARLQESSNLNQQLRQELKTVKNNCEALRQRQEEEQRSSAPDRDCTQSKWEKESQETTKELLKLKDRLIEVERHNATLQAEGQCVNVQLQQMQNQNAHLQSQIEALQRHTASLQESNTTMQAQSARLQVENSTLVSQNASLVSQNAQLHSQQSITESEREAAVRDREELMVTHQRLSVLQQRQENEYEELISKHTLLKNTHKSMENRFNQALKQKSDLEQQEKELKSEREKLISDSRKHQELNELYLKLRKDHQELLSTHQQLEQSSERLQADQKSVKGDLNAARLEHTRLELEFNRVREQLQESQISQAKLHTQCQLLTQLKENLEEENRHLLDQIQNLMIQNRALLEQSLENRELFHIEQREYMDKLSELRRQKEKLEEKIMDQYKFYEPSPPRRRGNWITLKMRKLIMKPKSRERQRPRPQTHSADSHDSSSAGSGCTSLEETQAQRSSTLKKLPFLRSRCRDKEELKAVYRRSVSMNDLLQDQAQGGSQWSSSVDHLESSESFSQLQEFGVVSREEMGHWFSEDLPDQGRVNGSGSRPHSESSADLDCSAQFGVLERQHSLKSTPRGEKFSRQRVTSRGILRSSSTRVTPSDSSVNRSSLRKAESVRSRLSAPVRSGLASHSKAQSVSESLDRDSEKVSSGLASRSKAQSMSESLDTSLGLPRSSSVISTAEGSVRRTSIHDLLSRDTRSPVLVDPEPCRTQNNPEPSRTPSGSCEYGLPPSTSLPCPGPELELSLRAFLAPSLTADSIFLNSFFLETAEPGGATTQPFLTLNTALVSKISGSPHEVSALSPTSEEAWSQGQNLSCFPPAEGQSQARVPSDEQADEGCFTSEVNGQSLWFEYGCI